MDRDRSSKPRIHSPLHSGDRQLQRSGGAYPYQAIGKDVYVSITLLPSINACNFNPDIRPGRQTSWLAWYIHDVTEQTCPDMPFLSGVIRAFHHFLSRSSTACKTVSWHSLVAWWAHSADYVRFHRMPSPWYTLHRQVSSHSTSGRHLINKRARHGRLLIPNFTVTHNLNLRYLTIP